MTATPELDAYLARLPLGLDSYPECQAKASLVRAVLALRSGSRVPDGTPSALRDLVSSPPPPGAWIREAHYVAVHYFIADADDVSLDSVVGLTYQANRELTDSRMYRALARVASPSIMIRGAALSWGLLHRGVRLSIEAHGHRARLRLTHPAHLYTDLAHRSAALGFRAVLEAAHGRDVMVSVTRSSAEVAEFDAFWR